MASPRRTVLLAALAAVLLVVNIVVLLQQDDRTGPDDEPSPTAVATSAPGDGGDDADGDGDGDDGDDSADDANGDDGDGDGDGENGDGNADDGGGDGADDGTGVGDGESDGADGANGGTDGTDAGHPDGSPAGGDVVIPDRADFVYASSGTWSLIGAGENVTYHLPAVATVVVEDATAGEWTVRRAAGGAYADEFGYRLGADNAIDWTTWVVERPAPPDARVTTATCASPTPFYRPGARERAVEHVCVAGDVVTAATVEQLGSQDVALGDGTVVRADRLRYDAVVTGPATTGTVTLDLWLDPATGLTVREERSSATTSDTEHGPLEQREDVTFLLRSRPDA